MVKHTRDEIQNYDYELARTRLINSPVQLLTWPDTDFALVYVNERGNLHYAEAFILTPWPEPNCLQPLTRNEADDLDLLLGPTLAVEHCLLSKYAARTIRIDKFAKPFNVKVDALKPEETTQAADDDRPDNTVKPKQHEIEASLASVFERAAEIMKCLRLSSMPGMDWVAVRLNSQPNPNEIASARMWWRALQFATKGDSRPADELAKEVR